MTITDISIAPDYRVVPDEDLAGMLPEAEGETFAAITAELGRRDRADRLARARRRLGEIRSEGDSAAFAQYLDVDAVTRGNLLSREGAAAGIGEQDLWRLPEDQAMRFASEEVRDYWLYVAPRITPAGYVRQRAAERRAEYAAAMDARKGTITDEHNCDGPGLARDEASALRHGTPASETPETGQRGAMDRGRPAPVAAEDSTEDAGRAGRPSRTVHPGIAGKDRDDMTITQETDEAARRLDAEVYGPGGTVPGGEHDVQEDTPGSLKHVLDEAAEFVGKHVAGTPAQIDAMTLYAAATYALHAFPTFGRMLFTSEQEASGKTVAMMVTAALSANPLDASGTSYALQSSLAAASNAPEQLTPTLYYDEISSVFGRSGLSSSRDPIADILRKGYKKGATRAWSVNRTSEPYSVYTPFLMAGLRNAVPRDIRSRCITLVMRPGSPRAYFDAREAELDAQALAACLAQAVATRITGIAAFRARGIHPRLRDRHLEVWEGLFAVAYMLGGQEWLNRCLAAFRELALAESDQVTLSPRQQVLRDAVTILDGPLAEMAETGFVGGLALRDEMRRLPDRPLYAPRSPAGMSKLISEAMAPAVTTQKRVDGEPVRGYFTHQIREAWAAICPAELEDASIAEEVDPFELGEGVTGEASVTAVTGESIDF